jgi:hypothetical protein
MRWKRAVAFGVVGAAAMSVLMALARAVGMPVSLEMMLGTMTGAAPGPGPFVLGLATHLTMGGIFGLIYGWIFERIHHGGAVVGVGIGLVHAVVAGLFMALLPTIHPLMPDRMAPPGAFMSNLRVMGVLAQFVLHAVFGAIVGGGYGHASEERPFGALRHA